MYDDGEADDVADSTVNIEDDGVRNGDESGMFTNLVNNQNADVQMISLSMKMWMRRKDDYFNC